MVSMVFFSSVTFSVRFLACGLTRLFCSLLSSLSRWNVIVIRRTGEMACKMFIASLNFVLKDSFVVCGLSRMYRELGFIFVALSLVLSYVVLYGVAASMWISVPIISSEEICGDGTVSIIGSMSLCSFSAGWSGVLTLVLECSMCATKQGSAEFEIWDRVGIELPSFVASALFLCLDDRRISGDSCSDVAFISIHFAAGFSGDGVFSSSSLSDENGTDFRFFVRADFS